jgi:coenzyme PQQ synthesis protein D (PqqD)
MSEPCWRRRPDVLWRRSLDAVLFLSPDADEPHTLTGSGPEVWELLVEPRTLAGIADELAARHGVETTTIEREVRPMLDELVELGALEVIE